MIRVDAKPLFDYLYNGKGHNNNKNIVVCEIDDKPFEISIRRTLPLENYVNFVQAMSQAEFTDDGEYMPENAKISFDILLCSNYTNLELPDKVAKAYNMIHRLDLVNKVLSVVECNPQYESLLDAINKAQEFYRAQKTGLNGLLSTISNVISGFDVNGALEQIKSFDPEMIKNFPELRQIADIFTQRQFPDNVIEFQKDSNQ